LFCVVGLMDVLRFLESSLDEVGLEVSAKSFDPSLDLFINDEDRVKDKEFVEESIGVLDGFMPDFLRLEVGEPKPVFAVDTSSIIIGECGDGLIFAIRGVSIGWNPLTGKEFIVHLLESPCFVSNSNKQKLYDELRKNIWGLKGKLGKAPSTFKMVDRIRNIYERFLQFELAKNTKNSILLFDGSLTGNTLDTPAKVLKNILNTAANNNCDVVAISKKSNLFKGEKIVNQILNSPIVPAIIPIVKPLPYRKTHQLLGKIYLARFSRLPIYFRVDVYSNRSHEKVFSDLLVSVFLESGYPKPLIKAHSYSYFNAFDALTIQAILIKRGIKVRKEFDIRKILFGSYR